MARPTPAKAKAAVQPPRAIDAETKHRARKVYALATKGQTDGEREAARSRMVELADGAGMSVAAFLSACGLAMPEKPRVRVAAVTVPTA